MIAEVPGHKLVETDEIVWAFLMVTYLFKMFSVKKIVETVFTTIHKTDWLYDPVWGDFFFFLGSESRADR